MAKANKSNKLKDDYDSDMKEEQISFYEKVADYVSRHPEFVEELQRKMDEEEKQISKNKYSGKTNYEKNKKENENDKRKESDTKKGFFKLDDEKINTISDELSGLLFSRDSSNKSALEKTIQDAFSGMVKNYLSKYSE